MERPDIVINRLKDFHNEVKNSGKIDKKSILSLEEFIGENLITSKININKVSETPRPMMAEQANQIVESKIKELETEFAPPTVGDIVTVLNEAYHRLLPNLIGRIKYYIGHESLVTLAMDSEAIKLRYIDNVLTDITTLPVDVIFGQYKDYISEVSSIIHGEDKSGEYLTNFYQNEDIGSMTPISIIHNFYLGIINSQTNTNDDYTNGLSEIIKSTPKPITIQDLIKIIQNASKICCILDKLYAEVNRYLDTDEIGMMNPNEPRVKAIYEVFKFIENSGDSEKLVKLVLGAMVQPLAQKNKYMSTPEDI